MAGLPFPFNLLEPQRCPHRRRIDRPLRRDPVAALPLDAPLSAAFDLSISIASWCVDCRVALRGPPPDPLEELELTTQAVHLFGLSQLERRNAEVAICMRLAGGFFAGGKPRM